MTTGDLQEKGSRMTMSTHRRKVALEAVCEIEALSDTLRDAVTPNEHMEHLVVRGLAMRIKQLSGAVMSALDDDAVDTTQISKAVGCALEEEPAL